MRKRVIQSIFFLLAFFAIERFCHDKTHGFRLQKIQANLPFKREWETSYPQNDEYIKTILSQPFFFLNSGGESYAFVSKDGKYVLKFFKLHHMRPKQLGDFLLPSFIRAKFQKHRIQKLNTFFSSCKLAYEYFREGTGLVYLHLNKTQNVHPKLQLFDAIGALHTLDLDQVPFALQEKATMAYPTLSALTEAQEFDAAKKRLSSLLDLIANRCAAGIADHDARKRNFGFVGEKAIEIDLGSFTLDESLKTPKAMRKTLYYETLKLRRYIKKYHPELSEFLDEYLSQNF